MPHRNAMLVQQGARTNARQLQQLRRANTAGTQNHLGARRGGDDLVATVDGHASAAQTTVGQRFQHQRGHLGRGPHLKIGPGITGGAQKGLGCVPAPARFLIDLKVRDTLVVATVEIGGGRHTGLLRRLSKGIQNVPAHAGLLDAPLAAGLTAPQQLAVGRALVLHQLRCRAARTVRRRGASVVVFVQFEVRQGLVPAPGGVASLRGPLVVIARLAAHVNHAVDAAAAAQGFAARVTQRAAVQARLGLGLVQPVGARVANAVQVAHRDVDPVVIVAATSLDQQHTLAGIGRQTVGQQAAGGTGADDDVVKFSAHKSILPYDGGAAGRASAISELWHHASAARPWGARPPRARALRVFSRQGTGLLLLKYLL